MLTEPLSVAVTSVSYTISHQHHQRPKFNFFLVKNLWKLKKMARSGVKGDCLHGQSRQENPVVGPSIKLIQLWSDLFRRSSVTILQMVSRMRAACIYLYIYLSHSCSKSTVQLTYTTQYRNYDFSVSVIVASM